MRSDSIKIYLTILFANILFVAGYAQTNGDPPELDASLIDELYCPQTEKHIADSFTLTDPDNTAIDGIFIQISSGYNIAQDRLEYRGTNSAITADWVQGEGKLKLSVANATTNYQIFIDALLEVVYTNSSANPTGTREFSITLDEANYLPSTDHYYEYVSATGINWQDAADAAASRNYYGLQGYLVTITTSEESQLVGEQAIGTGWIGGSDRDVEGTWRWMTGPEAGGSFWIGLGNGTTAGTDYPYAFWNNSIGNEPNQSGDEDYAHIVSPNLVANGGATAGSWNDLAFAGDPNPNSDYHPQGYIVEYGGMPGDPVLNNSASTKITIGQMIATIPANDICGSGTSTMRAISNTGVVNWYSSPTSTLSLFTGSTFTTPVISTTTTYYAAFGTCTTGRVPFEVTVFPLPTVVNVVNGEICESGTATLSVTPSEGEVDWYETPTSTDLIFSGTDFTTPVLTNTTTYYVEVEANGCTSATRTPVTATVNKIPAPVAPAIQEFCESDNALVSDLSVTGSIINWYDAPAGGNLIDMATPLVSGLYYASETVGTCEGSTRTEVEVIIFESVVPLPSSSIPVLQTCDDDSDGDDTNGQAIFDLTLNETVLLNGKNAGDFSFFYYEDNVRTVLINAPTAYYKTSAGNQTIYVQIVNNLRNTCITDTEIVLETIALPIIQDTVTLKNCDEDGTPDGLTDFNLAEADELFTLNDPNLFVSYYLTQAEAEIASNPVVPAPFNNATASSVFARIENSFGCYCIGILTLDVSTTQFPPGYVYELTTCENDDTNDGIATIDLTEASAELLNQLPSGQNLSVHYYRNVSDAQLELNEITPQDSYRNETPFNQTLIIRVENNDNGDCYDIGPFVNLTVYERPEFEVLTTGTVCLNNPPLEMEVLNANGSYTYEWTDPSGAVISTTEFAQAFEGGIYTVTAFSVEGCPSFTQEITVIESELANITFENITVIDDSDNNSITIDDSNLGSGEYEFTLDDPNGFYQDEPYFDMVPAGIHTVYVRDKNGCGVVGVEVSIIGYPRFFTPNNDGYNDTWNVRGVSEDFYPTSLIYIFDRFGKLIAQLDPRSEGWDGFFNGQMLPATDYWFSVQLIDKNNNIREKKGHFSLIRR